MGDDPHRTPSTNPGDTSPEASPETGVDSAPTTDSLDPSEQKTILRPSAASDPDLSPTVVVRPDSRTLRPSGPASPGGTPSGHTTPGGTTDSIVREGRFGKYQIFEKLGSGGFGKVYRGRDPLLSRDVAVKTCTSEDERLRRRFLHEAKIAAGLQHPNIVTVHDFGFEGDMPYMVQEYLTGEDLTEKIARRDLSVKDRARYLLRIAQGLAYAHDHNVVHRDIKPGNIRITDDGQLRILDFGIARLLDQTRPFTTDGVTLGTVGYMAPELLSDDEVDWRCDIFSYGVVAYELLSYSLPFQGDTFVRISYRLLNEEPPPLAEAAPDCPPALVQLVERCLRKRREDRYTTFHQVAEELAQLLDDTGTNPQSSPRTDSAPVLAVSGGAPTTPVPQAAAATSTPLATPTSAPLPDSPPTAPVEGRRRFGMSQMVGLIGLGLGAVAVALLLPGMVQDWTSPASTEETVALQGAGEPAAPSATSSLPAPAPEPSTASADSPSVPSPAESQGAVPQGASSQDAEPSTKVSPGLESPPRENVASGGLPALPKASEQPSAASNGADGAAATSTVKVAEDASAEEASRSVDLSPNRQTETGSAATPPEPFQSSEPSSGARGVDAAEIASSGAATGPAAPSEAEAATETASLPPTTSPEADVTEGSSISEAGEPPSVVPVETIPPQLLEQIQPEYPSRARRRRVEATVNVAVWVEDDGSVGRAVVKSISTRGMGFEDAATSAARQSRFAPGTEDGQPAAMWTEIVFHFRLSG